MPEREEIDRLRQWRHDEVTPALIVFRETLKLHTDRLDRLEPLVDRMARAEEIGEATAKAIRGQRRSILRVWDRFPSWIAATAAVGSFIYLIVHHHT